MPVTPQRTAWKKPPVDDGDAEINQRVKRAEQETGAPRVLAMVRSHDQDLMRTVNSRSDRVVAHCRQRRQGSIFPGMKRGASDIGIAVMALADYDFGGGCPACVTATGSPIGAACAKAKAIGMAFAAASSDLWGGRGYCVDLVRDGLVERLTTQLIQAKAITHDIKATPVV